MQYFLYPCTNAPLLFLFLSSIGSIKILAFGLS